MIRAVIGAQYGDEGKGKIVDYLSEAVDFAVRFNGSGNAGHCVEEENGTRHKVHIIPAAVFRGDAICCTGAGMVINPSTLVKEIGDIANRVSTSPIWIDPNAHIVTPSHILHDEANEAALGDGKIGTTLTGNGPAYADKALRKGIRLVDLLLNPEEIAAKLKQSNSYREGAYDVDEIAKTLHFFGIKLSPHFVDLSVELNEAIKRGKSILFAGAHGTFLDIDHGHYPFVTSSTCTVGGIGSTGVSPTCLDEVVGVVKSYTTRSGQGPMSSMDDYAANHIRKIAREIGTTTGRKRRIGWIDLDMIHHASTLNHFTYLAVTMLDVLSGLPTIELVDQAGSHKMMGWTRDISGIKSYDDLPEEAKYFIHLIENAAGARANLISVGPKRNQIIDRRQ